MNVYIRLNKLIVAYRWFLFVHLWFIYTMYVNQFENKMMFNDFDDDDDNDG